MRRLVPLVLVAAVGAAVLSPVSTPTSRAAAAAIGRADPLCNAGRGLHFDLRMGVPGAGAARHSTSGLHLVPGDVVAISSSRTLVSLYSVDAQGNPGPMRIFALSARCNVEASFGKDGVVDPSVPGVAPASTSFSLVAGLRGNFFATSSRGEGWMVGEFRPDGAIDTGFGVDGWVAITPPGGAAGFLTTPPYLSVGAGGNVLVFGENAQPHARVQTYLYGLRPDGQVNPTFGHHGHLTLFFPSVYAAGVLLQPNGTLVATGASGGAGCYRTLFEWISSTGRVQRSVGTRFRAAKPFAATSSRFWGTIFPDPSGGVGVVGSSSSCSAAPSDAVSHIQEFNPNGSPVRSFGRDGTAAISTPDPRDFNFCAAALPNRHLIVESFADGSSPYVNVRDFRSDGRAVRSFGHKGLLRLNVPTLLTTYTPPSDVEALPRGDLGFLIPRDNGLTFEEISG